MLEDANLLDSDGEGGANRTTGTFITVDGASFATGLFWQPIQNANDFMSEVEEASTGIIEGADLFAVKGGKAPQFGICVSQEGYKPGMNSAAIALMTALSDHSSIVGVFKVDGGWWYVCSRNDVILSDGDMLYLDEEEAKNQLFSMLSVPDWDKKFAPAEWQIEDAEDGNLEGIFERGKRIKLQKIKALRGPKLIMVIVGSVVGGGWLISTIFDKLFAPQQRKVVVPTKPKVVQTAPVVVPKPWENMPNPSEILTNCYKGVVDLSSLMPPGWTISGKITCTGETAATSWKKGVGMLKWADEAMRNSNLKTLRYNFDDAGTNLGATLALPKVSKIASPPTKNMTDLRFELNNLFQEMGLKVNLTKKVIKLEAPKQAKPAAGPGAQRKGPPSRGGAKQVQTTVNALGFSIKSEYDPLTWMKFLTKFPSLEINKIEYTTNNSSWSYEGAFYVL